MAEEEAYTRTETRYILEATASRRESLWCGVDMGTLKMDTSICKKVHWILVLALIFRATDKLVTARAQSFMYDRMGKQSVGYPFRLQYARMKAYGHHRSMASTDFDLKNATLSFGVYDTSSAPVLWTAGRTLELESPVLRTYVSVDGNDSRLGMVDLSGLWASPSDCHKSYSKSLRGTGVILFFSAAFEECPSDSDIRFGYRL